MPTRVRFLFFLCLVALPVLGEFDVSTSVAEETVKIGETDRQKETNEKRVAEIVQAEALKGKIEKLTAVIEANPREVTLYSQRGDALFFLGDFTAAVADYSRMTELDPSLDGSHWRRGIALFYAEKYDEAAAQFERYHSFDNVDRENGIWRFLSQTKASGLKVAREGLLKYEKDDREPFPDVYRLFAGTITPDGVLQNIADAKVSDVEREKRLFYAHLYIGLYASVTDNPELASTTLDASVNNTWGPTGGYGPSYMWHVGRLHAIGLKAKQASQSRTDSDRESCELDR